MKAKIHKPPRAATFLLRRCFHEFDRDSFIGDFEEFYNEILIESGSFKADTWYWRQVLKSLPKIFSNILYWRTAMLKNYLKIAYRNLKRHKGYSIINIGGLRAGITVGILILLYVNSIFTFDRFHENSDDTFLIYKVRVTPSGEQITTDTWVPLKDELVSTYPAIENGVRMWGRGSIWVQGNDKKFQETVTYADPSIFEIFTFPLRQGSSGSSLIKNTMILDRATAEKYFGVENPIGKTLTVNYTDDYTVTGVIEDIPTNSSINFNMLVPFENAMDISFVPDSGYDSSFLLTYIKLRDDANPNDLQAQFPDLIIKIWDKETESRTRFELTSLKDLNDFNSGGTTNRYALILLLVAVSIILIASINFMNLSTSQSIYRAREIGIRKVMGAQKKMLIYQFLGESIFLTMFALILGVALATLLLPAFNNLVGLELEIDYFGNMTTFLEIIMLGLIVGIASGSYPALYLSRFQPVDSLKGELKNTSKGVRMRNVLVFAQFAISIVLITGTLVIWNQIDYMKNLDLKFDKENVIVMPVSTRDFEDSNLAAENLKTFKNELRSTPGVLTVSGTSSIPGNYLGAFTFARPEGWDEESPLRVRFSVIDESYFETIGVEFVEGRNFDPDMATDRGGALIINEAMVKDIGWESAVGKLINSSQVIGVVKDFNYQSLQNPVLPVLHYYLGGENGNHRFIAAKITGDNVQNTIDALRDKWSSLDPTRDFTFFFLDDNLNMMYQSEENISKIVQYCAIIGIVIASLGLLGLASFTVIQRKKEIAIRKVVGASNKNIVGLLTKQFSRPIVYANLIAVPVSVYLMNMWLQNFAYRVSLGVTSFIFAGLAALSLSLIIVSYHSLSAAFENPVHSLRNE